MIPIYWNHRVFKKKTDYDTEVYEYSIREVFYNDEDDRIIGWTGSYEAPWGESLEELKKDLEWFLLAYDKPVLEIDPEDDNKLLGIELGRIEDEGGPYETYDSIEDLLAAIDEEDEDE